MSASVDEKICAVLRQVAELSGDAEITGEQELNADLAIDSLKLIDVVVQLEAELDIELGDEFSRDLITVADLQRHVGELVRG
ncbi:acyl carrier protein [Kitasatospora acidiphila]|uniref:Acyl carrier protein n=1 Tax=Kitasatospora acidiphila TaxID=2567942 RepID=A0A540W092_9ACTN|nr:acyl carrier protein [Kitasatospora acidiphila]TQF02420.1 acyl carrier protein [Kitasatospora acidiphila]